MDVPATLRKRPPSLSLTHQPITSVGSIYLPRDWRVCVCVCVCVGVGGMHGIKIPQQDFVLKMQTGLMRKGGTYLRDTTV